jgi:hypothetical protein
MKKVGLALFDSAFIGTSDYFREATWRVHVGDEEALLEDSRCHADSAAAAGIDLPKLTNIL